MRFKIVNKKAQVASPTVKMVLVAITVIVMIAVFQGYAKAGVNSIKCRAQGATCADKIKDNPSGNNCPDEHDKHFWVTLHGFDCNVKNKEIQCCKKGLKIIPGFSTTDASGNVFSVAGAKVSAKNRVRLERWQRRADNYLAAARQGKPEEYFNVLKNFEKYVKKDQQINHKFYIAFHEATVKKQPRTTAPMSLDVVHAYNAIAFSLFELHDKDQVKDKRIISPACKIWGMLIKTYIEGYWNGPIDRQKTLINSVYSSSRKADDFISDAEAADEYYDTCKLVLKNIKPIEDIIKCRNAVTVKAYVDKDHPDCKNVKDMLGEDKTELSPGTGENWANDLFNFITTTMV